MDLRAKELIFKDFGYSPHERQKQVHNSKARFKVVAAGARAGKSMLAGAEIANIFLKPNKNIWCVSTQYDLAEKEYTWALTFLANIGAIDLCRVQASARGSKAIVAPWGSVIRTKSTEKPPSLLGEELDCLCLGEASQISREVWERFLRARIGPRRGILLAISTPNSDGGLFREFYDRGLDPDEPDWESWQFDTLANPYFSREEWAVAKSELPESVFAEQYMGRFVSRRGHCFNLQEVHIVSELPENIESWPAIIGIQPGYNNPLVFIFGAIHPTKRYLIIIKEFYYSKTLLAEAVPLVNNALKGRRVVAKISDCLDPVAIVDMNKLGFRCIESDRAGLSRRLLLIRRTSILQEWLRRTVVGSGPGLFFYKDCHRLIEEFKSCKWPDPRREDREQAELETPLTKFFQGPQAVSHIISFLDRASFRKV